MYKRRKESPLGTYECGSCGEEFPNRRKTDVPGGCTECPNIHSFTFHENEIKKKTHQAIQGALPEAKIKQQKLRIKSKPKDKRFVLQKKAAKVGSQRNLFPDFEARTKMPTMYDPSYEPPKGKPGVAS